MNIPFVDLKAQYQALKPEIDAQIQKVLDHGQYIMGPEVDLLEKRLAEFIGAKHAIACSSGTDAAIIAMMAWQIGPGDEVIVPGFSFIATAEAVVLVGATPVLVDIDPVTYNLDPELIEAAITTKTKAICPVSLYGQPADMSEINAIAHKHGLYVIEDGAQSFGGMYQGKRSLNLSDVGCTSFFPAKPLGCYGDGGAIFTNDDDKAEMMKMVRAHGQKARYQHEVLGVNGRFDTLQAAIMLPKLERFSWELVQRQKIADRYTEAFQQVSGFTTPVIKSDRTSAWAQYTLRVPQRDHFQAFLKERGVPTSVHYPSSMSEQRAYGAHNIRVVSDDESRRAGREVVSLPMYPDMTPEIQEHIIKACLDAVS